jgi:hypothetical protein
MMFDLFEQSVGHAKMAKPETYDGLLDDAPGVQKQPRG